MRTVHPQVPPKVEYALTKWGQAMCPALDELLEWAALRPEAPGPNAKRHPQVTGGASTPIALPSESRFGALTT
jgi:DNA-binding HxlR family transcriptional regulator